MDPDDPPVPLPYDYEVEYIQRDFSIDWVDNGTVVRGGFDLSSYMPEGGFSSWNVAYETEMCAINDENTSVTTPIGFVIQPAFINWFGHGIPSGKPNYAFFSGNGTQTIDIGVPISLSSWHVFRTEWANGVGSNSFDGTPVAGSSSSLNTTPTLFFLLGMVAAGGTKLPCRLRRRRVKFSNTVDFIPVVKDGMVGFYNKIDGQLFLEKQDCLTAGPKV